MDDAVDLLIEASNTLEAIPEPLGEPMAILPETKVVAKPSDLPVTGVPRATWTSGLDTLPPPPTDRPAKSPNSRACPQCDSRAAKRVFRNGTELYLACPVCAHAWPYKANLP